MGCELTRRGFLGAAGSMALGAGAVAQGTGGGPRRVEIRQVGAKEAGRGGVVAIASGNGLAAVARARALTLTGVDPLEAAVAGVRIVEDDPEDQTVGLGGLPNEEGVVELDASVMHGPRHRAAGVAALRNIRNPAAVALEVARRTDHVLLVGEGALRFAKRMGFREEELLTEKSRQDWLKWKSELSREDDWLAEDEWDLPARAVEDARGPAAARGRAEARFTYGTIHCSVRTATGDLAGTTTTSGLSWKLAGRVGDSPVIGAGLYTDNEVGSAGATGRGEAVLQVCGGRTAVMRMEQGDSPTEAALFVLRLIASRTRVNRLLDEKGRPNFNVFVYALRKDGAYGAASMYGGGRFAVCDESGARHEDAAFLYERA